MALALAGCAGPPLSTYTLSLPPSPAAEAPLGPAPKVIAVSRVVLQSDMDGTDMILRDGSVLRRSLTGRWGSRLSVGMTDRLTERLAARYPRAVVTTTPLTDAPTVSIRVTVGRFDIDTAGNAVLEAAWLIVPANPKLPVRQDRTRITLQAPVATDQDVVDVTGALVDRLAARIDPGPLQ
ncbi:MAG: membrane integrity-associated transporter subunit PqiC [Proteobacteria bacterium]|nr:membrane integrity-associated transporter subunit PqiC [Pseudomonadota bacterium]